MATPPGWAKDTSNENIFSTTIPAKVQRTGSGGQRTSRNRSFTAKVNNTNGLISLIDKKTGEEFYYYNGSKWTSTNPATYDEVIGSIGVDGLNQLTNTAKTGAVKVINGTSSIANRNAIKEKDGYTSSLENSSSQVDEASSLISSSYDNFSIVGVQRKYGDYSYPRKEGKRFQKGQDTIQFKQYVYGKRSREGVTAGVLADRVFGNPVDGSVTLSIPTGIRDANRVNWSGQDANALQVELAKSSLQMMDNFGQGSKGLVTRATDAVSDPATQDNIKTILAGKAAGLNNAMARFNGAILNPNTELLFGGPGLRDFAYTIEMTPRSPDEAQHIRDIIRFFKEGMAVRRSVNGLFLRAPNVFDIRYLYENDEDVDHPYINRVKNKCALRDCSIDYTPQNTYMTHEDGSMIAYRMTLQFTELEPVYYDDYGTKTGPLPKQANSIGF